ncbi:hypothetical protein LTR08_006679 [Meristemomyces frigidus]|nr:hypothetical protein LTR08_006679 [Meristemomyces frigidus]
MAATDYNKLKVTELKELLKEHGIPSTGLTRKQQIVDALEADDAKVSDDANGAAANGADVEEGANGGDGDATASGGIRVIEKDDEVEAVQVITTGKDVNSWDIEAAGEKLHGRGDDAIGRIQIVSPEESTAAESAHADAPKDEPISASMDTPFVPEPERPNASSALETPRQSSPAAHDASSDTRKRKRRSPTPSISSDSVSKKLKSAEDAQLQDAMLEDAPAPLDGASDTHLHDVPTKVQPYGSSDDVVDVKEEDTTMSDVVATSALDTAMREDAATPSPALHPATRALYIRDLIRPLQPGQLRDHLLAVATPPHSNLHTYIIESFHLDTLRTHAFVLFASPDAASRARAALHAVVWPNEPTRKPLFADFIPDDRVQDWIDSELSAGTGRRDAKRWEVVYTTSDNSEVTATHQEITSIPSGPARQQTFSNAAAAPLATTGDGMPNAPLGPRGHRTPLAPAPPTQQQQQHTNPSPSPLLATPPPAPDSSSTSFNLLDSTFRSTTAKPKIYFLPQGQAIAEKRLDELDALTSRDWARVAKLPLTVKDGELRRFTFEDEDKLVDGGPDRGSFGLPAGGFRGRGGGGGGGGYRGGRGGGGGGWGGGERWRGR